MHGAKRKSYELDSGQDTKKHKSRQAQWWQKAMRTLELLQPFFTSF